MKRPGSCVGLAILILSSCSTVDCAGGSGPRDSPRDRGRVSSELPESIGVDETYVFYLHGAIVEERGIRPESAEFGVYEYEKILDALAAEGLHVISEARGRGTDARAYARKVVGQIEELLAAGVPARRIAVVGFSKGGGIAVVVCSLLGNEDVRFVFLGTCASWIRNWPDLQLRGHILSIYEESDPIGRSCEAALAGNDVGPRFEELKLSLGERHGTFYRPRPEWVEPVVDWIKQASPEPASSR